MLFTIQKKYLIFIIFCLCLLFPGCPGICQNLGFYFEKNANKVKVHFELHNNLIVIPITLNDTYTLNFILDTGVRPTILINREIADALGADYQRSIELLGVGNTTPVEALVAENISMSLPGIKSSGISVLVLKEDLLQLEHHLGIRIHGIIGYDLFSRFVVKIDYIHKIITLYEPADFKEKRKFRHIDLDIVESKPVVLIDLQISATDTISTKLLIDTGASHALVLNQGHNEHIHIPDSYIITSLGRGLAGEVYGKLGRIDGLDFGERRLNGVIASFPDESTHNTDFGNDRDGSIGGELLKKFTVIFNFLKGEMYVKPNASFRYPFEYNMSGLEFSAEGKSLNQFVITNIRKNSATYKTGFKIGDLVVSLNNTPSEKLTLTKIYTKLNLNEGKKINMTVLRDGKYISKSFHLKREI